jgi:hypothetical protein
MCHGKDGDGKGDLAAQMKLELKDWRDPSSIASYTDSQLFYITSNGRGKMVGGEGDRTTEEVHWNLVNLVHSFAKKSQEEPAATSAAHFATKAPECAPESTGRVSEPPASGRALLFQLNLIPWF